MGFGLAELARVFAVRDRGGVPCRQVHALALEKLALLEHRISELSELRRELRSIIKQWESQLERTPAGQRAGLLKMLVDVPSGGNHEDQISSVELKRGLRRRPGRPGRAS